MEIASRRLNEQLIFNNNECLDENNGNELYCKYSIRLTWPFVVICPWAIVELE